MIRFNLTDFVKVVLAFLFAGSQSSVQIATANVSVLHIGDEIDGMTLTNGAADARPLWVFCSSEISNHVTTANCRVPQMSKLAIGHAFLAADNPFQNAEWSELEWQLYIDDKLINLDDFSTYHYVLPTMAASPSPIREVFMKFTAWDIVLMDLEPGVHMLQGLVRSDAEEYRWNVELMIETRSVPDSKPAFLEWQGLLPS
jgi:hypothetical protein